MNSLTFGILGAASAGASSYSGIILILLMIALMYFFMIRPQQKQRKQHQDMMSSLHPGNEVVTIGRLHGKIDSINKTDRTVTLDCEGIYLTFDMVAIARVVKTSDSKADNDSQPAASATPVSAADQVASAEPAADSAADSTADSAADQEK
ncbi:preprotein translocase subunit YajC [Limosilactobacillus pontis]|uniref:preprotein translocase subunit YajC n=1 Tax=Limosilactobacillus pontis TaxID=35787 RepID=UPI000710A93D|nr:preprotein translocase subunit YajC [Limosilactobacillus pontis]QFV00713.1 preprotein translocase subunit YajC [Limosilactobacillus pontis]